MFSESEIEILLLDVTKEFENDPTGDKLSSLLDDILSDVSDARTWLSKKEESQGLGNGMKNQILKFVKRQDQYMALASTLLKSRAFHSSYPSTPRTILPPIDLPRSVYKKPFIPVSTSSALKEENIYPLSISHQFPFVGMARLVGGNVTSDPLIHVGFDIVCYDVYNPRMYETIAEFVDVFQDNFAPSEWELIQQAQNEDELLHEFCLRWAIKEAYTKALGVGLGFDFGSFETHLDVTGETLWGTVSSHDGMLKITGKVVQRAENERLLTEHWMYCFQPLYTCRGTENKVSASTKMSGCACSCVGPIRDPEKTSWTTRVGWTSLGGLIKWHRDETDRL